MWFARAFANSVVLPDGKIFITGGQTYAKPFTDTKRYLDTQVWDPTTTKFAKMAANTTPRTYHPVALRMPDTTVFTSGGVLCGTCTPNHFDSQLYSSHYLFLSNGVTRAPRPVISSLSSTSVQLGATLTVTMESAVTRFALVRMGATTHTVNIDQQRIPLTPTVNRAQYTVCVPADADVALPGYWIQFALDANGVPSLARTVLVTL